MKKLFTLVALLACFMGAKAAVEKVYSIDYSTKNSFPFFVMGYVPEWIDGVMTDFGAAYRYATQADLDGDGDAKWKDGETPAGTAMAGSTEYVKVTGAGPYWHQYFIGDGIPTELDGAYTVKALVKASEACNINVNMGWGWGAGQSVGASVAIPAGDDFVEVEWEYTGIGGTSCNLVAQPGTTTATIEWKSLEVYTDKGDAVPQVWLQMITDNGNPAAPEGDGKYVGDAEFGAWPAWALEKTDGVNTNWRTDKAASICAWALTYGDNKDEGFTEFHGEKGDRSRPYPATIAADPANASNHVFMADVHDISCIDDCDGEGASIAWSNQFWIMSPQTWKAGTKVHIKFKYKADHACSVGTQFHTRWPSKYLHWNAVGDISFTEEWQEFDKTVELSADQAGSGEEACASLAFNLCSDATNGRTPNKFYFDDLSWEVLKLEEGLFVAGKGKDFNYDYAQATQFEYSKDDEAWVATIGTQGKKETWVDEVQISTVRGDKSAFLGATLKPTGNVKIVDGFSEWLDFTESSQAKIKVPSGVYKIYVALEDKQMQFEQLEGEAAKEPVAIALNETECVVHGAERDWKPAKDDGTPQDGEEGIGTGQPWDNQFWIAANRDLETGEVTVLKFKYKATTAARTSTQAHKVGDDGKPCTYLNWQAIGDVNFTEEWQEFEKEFTVPEGDNGMRSIVFNMAEVKYACDYYLKDFQWYVKDAELEAEGKTMENLINATGAENFWIKENKGNPTGISTVVTDKKGSAVIYNLAGQRVSKDFKGIAIKNGKKVVMK